MAKSANPLIGKTSGSVGGVTFSKWKNLNIIKEKPIEVANPNTINQQMRRGMFSALIEAARLFIAVSDIGFIAYRNVMSQFNAFVKYNYGTFVVAGAPPAFTVNYNALVFSKGPLSNTDITAVSSTDSSADVVITFPTATSAPDQASTDLAYAVAYNDTTGDYGIQLVGAARSTGTITVTMNGTATTGDTVYGYLFFTRADGSVASDSQQDTTTTV